MSETQPNTEAAPQSPTQSPAPAAAATTFNVRLVIALLLPLVALLLLIVRAELVLMQGKRWTVAITGYDPRDLVRGHYLLFRLKWKPASSLDEQCPSTSENCYLCLERQGGDTSARPEPTMRRVYPYQTKQCDSAFPAATEENLHKYFIPEDKGAVLERAIREKEASLVLAVSATGEVVIKDLLLNDEPWTQAIKHE
jgi:uncharacterized membrane-anchored protein